MATKQDDAGPAGFSLADARRVGRATKRVERAGQGGGVGPRGRNPVGFIPQGYNARTGVSGIPAMTGTTPGKATVRLWDYNDSDVLVDSGVDVDAYNTVAAVVAANTMITLLWVQGRRQVVVEPCS